MQHTTRASVGTAQHRVDGPRQGHGRARNTPPSSTRRTSPTAIVVSSSHRQGPHHVASMQRRRCAVPGVLKVFTHENRPRTAWLDRSYRDEVAPPGSPFRPLYDDEVQL